MRIFIAEIICSIFGHWWKSTPAQNDTVYTGDDAPLNEFEWHDCRIGCGMQRSNWVGDRTKT